MKCPQCGQPIPEGKTVCEVCDYDLNAKPKARNGNPAQQPIPTLTVGDGVRFGIGFGIASAIFSIIAYGLWYVMR